MSSLERDERRRVPDALLAETRASRWAPAHSKPDGPHLHLIRADLQVSAAEPLRTCVWTSERLFITDTHYLYVYVPDNRYAEPIFIYWYKVINK